MKLRKLLVSLPLAGLLAVAGCSDVIQKSSSPLSPTIAGPLDGVTVTSPVGVSPAQNAQIKFSAQPVTFSFDSATSTSPRPFTMHLQVATDYPFAHVVFDRAGFEKPADGNRISFRLPSRLPAGIYYWRVRAEDGANNSDWSPAGAFEALEEIIIGTPVADSPVNNERVTSRTPTLTAKNSTSSGPHKAIQYQFQVSSNSSFTGVVADGVAGEGGSTTSYGVPTTLNYDTTYFWRVRASDGDVTSDWIATAVFRTPVVPVVVPPTGGGGGGGGGATSCSPKPTTGPAVIACVASRYPQKLVAGVSLSERQANMAFIRDRIIEVGLCGGMELGWNLKRGGPELSIDFIAWRQSGGDMGVDIGFDYDNTSIPLQLSWNEWGSFGASYANYTNGYSCGTTAAVFPVSLAAPATPRALFERFVHALTH